MLVGVAAFLGSEVVLSPVVSGCIPSCGGWVLVGVAASRTKIFRNQNHRFQSKFVYCKLFGVYAGVIPCSLFVVILTLFVGVGCFLTRFHNKTRTFSPFRFFNFFDVHFSW